MWLVKFGIWQSSLLVYNLDKSREKHYCVLSRCLCTAVRWVRMILWRQTAVCFLTCVFWILKSTDDLFATSSLGMLCSMASEGESRHSVTQHQRLDGVVNKIYKCDNQVAVRLTFQFSSHHVGIPFDVVGQRIQLVLCSFTETQRKHVRRGLTMWAR